MTSVSLVVMCTPLGIRGHVPGITPSHTRSGWSEYSLDIYEKWDILPRAYTFSNELRSRRAIFNSISIMCDCITIIIDTRGTGSEVET